MCFLLGKVDRPVLALIHTRVTYGILLWGICRFSENFRVLEEGYLMGTKEKFVRKLLVKRPTFLTFELIFNCSICLRLKVISMQAFETQIAT